MNKNNDDTSAEIDDIEIVDLDPLSDKEPLAESQTGKKPDDISKNRAGRPFKPWLRRGMAVTIFAGCIALCLLLWPTIATTLPGIVFHQGSTPTPIPTIFNQQMAEKPLLTSVFVFGDTAYISTFTYSPQSSNTSAGRLDAIHISDGKVFWHASDSVIAPPVEANGILFIPAKDGIRALRARDRVTLWHTTNLETIYRVDNGLIYTQPYQDAGLVVVTGGDGSTPSAQNNILEARRILDGSVVWQHITDEFTSYAFTSYAGESSGIVYLSTYDITNTNTHSLQGRLDAIRVSDGSVLWSKANANVVEILNAGNSLVCLTTAVQSNNNTQNSSNIDVLNRSNGKEIWHKESIMEILSAEQGTVYTTLQVGTTTTIIALRLTNGSVLWQKNGVANQAVEKVGSKVYLFSSSQTSNNNVTVLNAANGNTIWQRDMPGYTATIAGNAVYSLSNRSLDAWQTSSGSHLWQNNDIQLSQSGFFDGIATNGVLYAITNNGWVIYAVRISDGKILWDYQEPLLA